MSWKIEVRDRALVVTMNTNKVNAQNEDFFSDLHEAMDRLDADYSHSPVVLTGTQDCFSAGLDINYTFPILASGDAERIEEWWQRYRATNLRLFTAERPMIAAVNGHAIAGGLITALCCDYRVGPKVKADESARFALNEVLIGIRMPRIYVEIIRNAVGNRAMNLWTLFGRSYDSNQALSDGFLDELIDRKKLLERALEVAHEISEGALEAFVSSKRALRAAAVMRIESVPADADGELVPGADSIAANTGALAALKATAGSKDR